MTESEGNIKDVQVFGGMHGDSGLREKIGYLVLYLSSQGCLLHIKGKC